MTHSKSGEPLFRLDAVPSPDVMDILNRQMSVPEYAALERAFGAAVICKAGVYWRRVRPFFYRPLVPLQQLDPETTPRPASWPRGCKFAVGDPASANSTMSFLVYDDPREYSIEKLGHNRRQKISRAAKSFRVRRIVEFDELREHGHRAYLSFFRRTNYGYKSDRASRAGFDRWVDTLARFPKAIVLGAYRPDGLCAVSVSYWVEDTLWCASLFSDSDAANQGIGEVMLHELRQIAARQPGIGRIVMRPYRGGNNHDQYYMIRGCKIVRFPARLEIHPVIRFFVKRLLPKLYATMCGDDDNREAREK